MERCQRPFATMADHARSSRRDSKFDSSGCARVFSWSGLVGPQVIALNGPKEALAKDHSGLYILRCGVGVAMTGGAFESLCGPEDASERKTYSSCFFGPRGNANQPYAGFVNDSARGGQNILTPQLTRRPPEAQLAARAAWAKLRRGPTPILKKITQPGSSAINVDNDIMIPTGQTRSR